MGTKVPSMGKSNIGALTNLNENPDISNDAKVRALRRTMLIKSLNTKRCTSPEEMAERFEQLFEMCFKNNFIPTVEALSLCTGIDRRQMGDMEHERYPRICSIRGHNKGCKAVYCYD